MTNRVYPTSTDDCKYLRSSYAEELSLQEIIDYATAHFPNVDFNDILIEKREIQEAHFGYDLYDGSDYGWYYTFTKK